GLAARPGADELVELARVTQPAGGGGEALIACPGGPPDRRHETIPVGIGEDRDRDPPVVSRAWVDTVRCARRFLRRVAGGRRDAAVDGPREEDRPEEARDGLELCQVDELAPPRPPPMPERGEHGER